MKVIGTVVVTQYFVVETETSDSQDASDAILEAFHKNGGKGVAKRTEGFAIAGYANDHSKIEKLEDSK